METICIIKKRHFGENNILQSKQHVFATSTPMKKTADQLETKLPFTVIKTSYELPSPIIPTDDSEKQTARTDVGAASEISTKQRDEANKSVDKICLVNNIIPESNDPQEVSPSDENSDGETKRKQAKQLIVMDSDEEEAFWQSRNKPGVTRKDVVRNGNPILDSKRSLMKKRMPKPVEDVQPVPNVEKTMVIDSEDDRIILPKKNNENSSKAVPSDEKDIKKARKAFPKMRKNTKKRSEGDLKILKNLPKDSSRDSEQQTVQKPSADDGDTLRRSNRKRCKPLEFWNGQKFTVERDLFSGIKNPTTTRTKRDTKKVQDTKVEPERHEIEHEYQISTNIPNSSNKHKPETSLTEKGETKRQRKSILKTRTSTKSKTNVKFSAIGSGTTIDGSIKNNNIKPDWVINFTEIHSKRKALPGSENCVVWPGLNTAKEIISSAIMQMRPKFIHQSQAPDLHHLIFCVMAGTVTVTIDEISVRMETYGHFAVPCGVTYSIENIGRTKAVLSYFKVAYNCLNK